MFRADDLYKNAPQSGNSDVDQVAYRQPCCFEVDSDHRSDFQVDEQEQDVRKSGSPAIYHPEESLDGRPHSCCANRKQRQIVKNVDQKRSERVGKILQLHVKTGSQAIYPAHWFGHEICLRRWSLK